MIKGLSDRRRLPRAGVIKLGIKKKSEKSGNEYPVEVDYFVCPQLIQEIYGSQPKELIIMFPVESEQVFFQQFYKCYGKGILLCRGDGDNGTYWDFDKGDFAKRKCPCEKLEAGKCKPIGILQFLLPEVKESVGVWQISTSSKNSIIDINSGVDLVREVAGRAAMIPLLLKREPIKTHRIEGKDIKTGTHYTMKLSLGMSLVEIQKLGQIPPARALLPMPDESQKAVNDLFPPNGFKPEEEEEAKDEEPVDDIQKAKERLGELRKEFIKLGGKISVETAGKITGFKTFEEYSGEIDRLQAAIDEKKAEKAKKEKVGSGPPTKLFEPEEAAKGES